MISRTIGGGPAFVVKGCPFARGKGWGLWFQFLDSRAYSTGSILTNPGSRFAQNAKLCGQTIEISLGSHLKRPASTL
jgi:hypothetical protein